MASTREQHMRPLVPDDLDALSRIHVAACRVAYRFMDWDYSLAEVRDWYDRKLVEWDWALVAEQDGGAVGYLAMKGAHIDQFFVDPVHQGQGIGTTLFATALNRNVRPLSLDVFAENTPARRFYEHRGFREVGRWFNAEDRAMQLRYELHGAVEIDG